MKKILATAFAALAVIAAPAAAQSVNIGGTLRIGNSGYVHIQTQPDYRQRDYRGQQDRYDWRRSGYDRCAGRQDLLTIYNAPRGQGWLVINGRRYQADNQLCVHNVYPGSLVFHDRNFNGRLDRNELSGRIRQEGGHYNYGRAGFSDQYTVTLRR